MVLTTSFSFFSFGYRASIRWCWGDREVSKGFNLGVSITGEPTQGSNISEIVSKNEEKLRKFDESVC